MFFLFLRKIESRRILSPYMVLLIPATSKTML